MAKITPGPTVGQISGSIGSTVYSHNRYGAYIRSRTIPTNPNTAHQQVIRSILAACSSAWKALTTAQKVAWQAWAQTNPIIDRLGAQQVLAGNAAYIALSHRIMQTGGAAATDPPVTDVPPPLLTLVGEFDIGPGDFDLTFTGTPLAAGHRLYVQAAVTESPAVNYTKNLLKLIVISAAAEAGPLDIQTELTARFGTLQVGQTVHAQCSVLDGVSGLLSTPIRTSGLIVDTTV